MYEKLTELLIIITINSSVFHYFHLIYFPFISISKNIIQLKWIGLILSVFLIGEIISFLILRKFLTKIGQKNFLSIFYILNILLCIITLSIFYVKNQIVFIILILIARIFQGISITGINRSLFSFIPNLFSENESEMNFKLSLCTSISYLIGTIIGAILFYFINYIGPFLGVVIFTVLTSPYLIFLPDKTHIYKIPSPSFKRITEIALRKKREINTKIIHVEKISSENSYKSNKKNKSKKNHSILQFSRFCLSFSFLLTISLVFLTNSIRNFIFSTISTELILNFNAPITLISLIFSLNQIMSCLTMTLIF